MLALICKLAGTFCWPCFNSSDQYKQKDLKIGVIDFLKYETKDFKQIAETVPIHLKLSQKKKKVFGKSFELC